MKKTIFLSLMCITAFFCYGEEIFPKSYKQSNSISLSLFGAFATELNTNASSRFYDYYNVGYQKIFHRFGFAISMKSLYLEKDDPAPGGDYLNINYLDLSIKPLFVVDENSFLFISDYLIYIFGVIVFKDEFIENDESFNIKEFTMSQTGFGIGMDFRLFDHFSFFNEISLYAKDNSKFAQFKYAGFTIIPGIEFGIKWYL